MQVPAFCNNCGAVFGSGIEVDNARSVTFVGNKVGPCPTCGGMGEIPDGVYDFVGDTIRVLAAPERSRERLEGLAELVAAAREQRADPADVAAAIKAEAPELEHIADRLLVPRSPADVYALLTLIWAILVVLLGLGQTGPSEQEVERLTRDAVDQAIRDQRPPAAPRPGNSVP